jgi:hypothetical protein
MDRFERQSLDDHITGHGGEDQFKDDRDELLQIDAVMGLINAIEEGWSETEEFTVELVGPEYSKGIEVDLPATKQTIHISIDIRPST